MSSESRQGGIITTGSQQSTSTQKEREQLTCSCRLWIGNLDTDLAEMALIKVCQKYGNIIKFDMLYHKTGPDRAKSKGYCFVTYETHEEAEAAMKALHGRIGLRKRMVVKWAHSEVERDEYRRKAASSQVNINLAQSSDEQYMTKEEKIRAIEAKLRLMEGDRESCDKRNKRRKTS